MHGGVCMCCVYEMCMCAAARGSSPGPSRAGHAGREGECMLQLACNVACNVACNAGLELHCNLIVYDSVFNCLQPGLN